MKKVRWTCLALSVLLALGVFAGCAQQTDAAPEKQQEEAQATAGEAAGQEAESTAGQSGKTLRIGFGHSLDDYAPTNAYETKSPMINLVYETIVRYDDGEIQPGLAESWEWDDAQTTLTLHVRKGVAFHDGTPLDAEALAQNLKWANQNPLYAFFKGIGMIEEVNVVDEQTLTITYPEPYYAALQDMCAPVQLGIVSPAMLDFENFDTMNGTYGTGPYVYESFDNARNVATFTKNIDYWDEQPPYDTVEIYNIGDASARLMALETGEIDMVFGSDWISYDDYEQALQMENVTGQLSDADIKTRIVTLNAANPALADKNVREAIVCAIDKEAIVSGFMHGHEGVADQILGANLPYCDVKMNAVQQYDLQKAADLLDAAGWMDEDDDGIREKDGVNLSLVFSYPQERTLNMEIAETIKASLGEIGISVETVSEEYMVWAQKSMSGEFNIIINTSNGLPYDPQSYLNAIPVGMMGEYYSVMALADGQEFMDRANETLSTNDTNVVGDVYAYVLNYLNDNSIDIPISTQKELVLYRTDTVAGFEFGGAANFLDIFKVTPA